MPYEVHIKQFEGPLDLLLHLIEQAKVDIRDIFISEITSAYLAFMEDIDELDMDTASEFLSMAATLVYIKSRSLIPKPPKDDIEEEDPEIALVRQLREYKAFKEVGINLSRLQEEMREVYARLPEDFHLPAQEYDISDATTIELLKAFVEALSKGNAEALPLSPLHAVSADRYTVRSQRMRIRNALANATKVGFGTLFDGMPTKLERIVTFMALLDMLSRGEILLKQSERYGSITIMAGEAYDYGNNDVDALYMDEQ